VVPGTCGNHWEPGISFGYLKIYFPQMLEWFERLDRKLVCDFLERWTSLEELKKVPPAELRKFFGQRHGRHHELTEERIQGVMQAMPAIQDRANTSIGHENSFNGQFVVDFDNSTSCGYSLHLKNTPPAP
jgi:hypothetical protein